MDMFYDDSIKKCSKCKGNFHILDGYYLDGKHFCESCHNDLLMR